MKRVYIDFIKKFKKFIELRDVFMVIFEEFLGLTIIHKFGFLKFTQFGLFRNSLETFMKTDFFFVFASSMLRKLA